MDEEAVLAVKMIEGVEVGAEGPEAVRTWDRLVVDKGREILRGLIASRHLDRLIEPEPGGRLPLEEIQEALKSQLERFARPHRIRVLGVGIGALEVLDERVVEQRIVRWRSRWIREQLTELAEGEAQEVRLLERAYADAQRQTLASIVEGFHELVDQGVALPADVIALRFIDALERLMDQPELRDGVPEAAREMGRVLRGLIEGENDDGSP